VPIPTLGKKEDRAKFISRCMSNPVMKRDFKDNKQRLAVCYSQWRKKKATVEDDKMVKKEVKRDKDGDIIVAENISLILNATFSTIQEKIENKNGK